MSCQRFAGDRVMAFGTVCGSSDALCGYTTSCMGVTETIGWLERKFVMRAFEDSHVIYRD
jgi:hypothetical protein